MGWDGMGWDGIEACSQFGYFGSYMILWLFFFDKDFHWMRRYVCFGICC